MDLMIPVLADSPDAILRGHLTDVQSLTFLSTACGKLLLASGSLDGLILLWDTEFPSSPVHKWVAHGGGVVSLCSTAESELWSQGRDGWIYRWEIPSSTDQFGHSTILAPVRTAALPVGFGSFCRMHVFHRHKRGDNNRAFVAAPALDSERIEVWEVSSRRGGSISAAGRQLTRVHEQSAPYEVKGTVNRSESSSSEGLATLDSNGDAGLTHSQLTLVGTFQVAKRRRKAAASSASSAAAAAAELEGSTKPLPEGASFTTADGDYRYTDADDEEESSGEHQLSALQDLQGKHGMVTCVQLLDPAFALPQQSADVNLDAVKSCRSGAVSQTATEAPIHVPPSSYTANSNSSGDAATLVVHHPLPEANSLREMFSLRGASTSAHAIIEGSLSVPSDTVKTRPSSQSLFSRRPRFLLAATFENGRFYVLSDQPPPSSADNQTGRNRQWPMGLAGLHAAEAVEDAALPPPPSHPDIDAAKAVTRGAVLIDIHLSPDPILAFTLSADYTCGIACGSGSEAVVFSLDIPTRTGSVSRRIVLSKPGISTCTLLQPPVAHHSGARESSEAAGMADTAASPPASVAITGGWDGLARVIDLNAGDQLAVLRWHGCSVYSIAAAASTPPASADDDGAETMCEPTSDPGSSSFRVATGAKDGRIALWTVDLQLSR